MANILLILTDEHNPYYSSVYGHPFIETPNMDWLANNGTVYSNAYCSSPLCMPSRCAFMSGKRVHDIQTYNNCNVNLNRDIPSYGKVLSEQGIHTVYIGKSDIYNRIENVGFSETMVTLYREEPGDTNIGRRPLTIRYGAAKKRADKFGIKEDAFDVDIRRVDAASQWLSTTALEINQPWVLTVSISKPHFPQWNTKEFWDMYPNGGDLPKYGIEYETANHPYARDLRNHFEADLFTEEQIRGLRRGYLGNVSFADRQIGRLIRVLQRTGQINNTNIIYASDHGEMLGKFGMWWKCSLYEDSVRIPCIAIGPDFAKGKLVQTPVDLLDVQASLFKSVGAKRPNEWVGKPLQEITQNDTERVVFSEYHGHGTRSGAYMIRKGDWKLIYYMEAPHQLFNLSKDPNELNNVYHKYSQKGKELEEELRNICSPEKENEKAHIFEQRQIELIKEMRK